MTTNESGINPGAVGGAYVDTGTAAHPGPPASVTVESPPEHLSDPTGAAPNPPASVRSYQWPATEEEDGPKVAADTKQVTAAEVEDKAVTPAKSSTKKKG